MVGEYLNRAKIQETEREIVRIHLAATAERAMTNHRVGAVPKPRTVSAVPLRLLRRARVVSSPFLRNIAQL